MHKYISRQSVAGTVNSTNSDFPEIGATVVACRRVLDRISFYKVLWVRRIRNGVVYELARRSHGFVSTLLERCLLMV